MTFSLHQGGVVMSRQVKHTHSHQDTPLNNNKHNMVISIYKIWKKSKEIHITKNKMDLNNRNVKKLSTRY